MLEKFEKFNRRLSGWFEWIGFFAIFLMVVLTCVDVFGAKLFRTPVFGALDVMMLAQLIAVSFAVSMALIAGRHVQVEFFVPLLPKRLQHLVDCIVHFLGFALFVFIVWRLFVYGYHMKIGGEESMTARIPLWPFAYAAAIGCVPVCLIFLQHFFCSIQKLVKK
ncbi:MAG: TRAP transporter small permease [Deltaproteobacteria bacterium]|nr:TRAP transporter small permease [Deltaproteobacteria bacterium]MBW2136783.1 TRAP transporter small permease [Deltaproteobacteria bacterium]